MLGGALAPTRLTVARALDTADYSDATSGVAASLATGSGSAGDAAGDVLISIEKLAGRAYGDTLTGGNLTTCSTAGGNDSLIGGSANDTILGGAGDDIVMGSAGADQIDGGAGLIPSTIRRAMQR